MTIQLVVFQDSDNESDFFSEVSNGVCHVEKGLIG